MFAPARLKIHLKLAINRIKLVRAKREALSLQNRRAIATLLADNKLASATIRVEGIIRDDDFCEALEILELYCELLLARFGLVEAPGLLDSSIEEAIYGLIYSAARCGEIKELAMIRDQLAQKVGKESYMMMLNNSDDKVIPRLVLKLGAAPPHQILVERYLAEIAQRYGVPGFEDVEEEEEATENAIELISLEEDIPISFDSEKTNVNLTSSIPLDSNVDSSVSSILKPNSTTSQNSNKPDLILPTPPKTAPAVSRVTPKAKSTNAAPAVSKPNSGTGSIPTFEELESRFNALKKI